MKSVIFTILLIVVGLKYGCDYITSAKFQQYADEKKYPWTCTVNNSLGGYYQIKSEYGTAYKYYQPVLKRCPKSEEAQTAMFEMASCLESMHRTPEAIDQFQAYIDAFPTGSKKNAAENAINQIKLSR